MNIFAKLLPYLLNAAFKLIPGKGWKKPTAIFGALLVVLMGVQAIQPELIPMMGQYGQAFAVAVSHALVMLEAAEESSKELPPPDLSQ